MLHTAARHAWGLSRRLRQRAPVSVRSLWMAEGALHGRLAMPSGAEGLAAVLLVPGLGGTAASLERWDQPLCLQEIAALGIAALALDLSGRGESQGSEDYGGPLHQADVVHALAALRGRSEVSGPLGVVSLSLGCAAVAGALAQSRPQEVAWWIDWEGPSDRDIITAGGRILDPAMGHTLEDEAYWQPREALRWVGETGVPYCRYQSIRDHAQPTEHRHALRMVRAAQEGALPWFQLNDHPRNELPERPEWRPAGARAARRWLLHKIRELLPS